MDIGGALAEARSEAGLTITQVSQHTRIRETIIRDIERDDYAACGGDFYARGHIRAIARVVGTDPVPLIAEYDAARMPPAPPGAEPGRASQRQPAAEADTNPDVFDGGSLEFGLPDALWPSARRRLASWLAAARPQNASAAAQPGPVPRPDAAAGSSTAGSSAAGAGARASTGITAAEAFRPGLPLDFERRRPRLAGMLGLLALAVVGVLIYLLVARGPAASRPPATPRSHDGAAAAAHHASAARNR